LSRRDAHPDLLPWYAAGRLQDEQSRQIERHLEICEACRAEVAAQRSVAGTLRAHALAEHPPAERLVIFCESRQQLDASEAVAIEQHVSACPACAHDLVVLARASARSRPRPLARVLAAAATVAVAVLLGGWWLGRSVSSPSLENATRVIFPPPQRGGDDVLTLTGDGPWAVTIWKPLTATSEVYVARIHPEAHPEQMVFQAVALPLRGDGSVEVVVTTAVKPGSYVLTLSPRQQGAEPIYAHRFEVQGRP
jgi:hypothetical protein